MTPNDFSSLRYGLFVHFGLYSVLGRGEWAMNREQISPIEYSKLAQDFNPTAFDADAICDLAVRSGMRYIVFTTMHHDGFRLYETELSDFNSVKSCGRDFTAEMIAAARKRGLKIGLYHSLNNWMDSPDAVDALENPDARETFLENTFARIREVVTRYNPIDVLWYDGWWPFEANGWRASEMNAMVRAIQPHILFNGRNGLAGDFSTPEGHLAAPKPWRAWEACLTLNNNWGFHSADHDWKSAWQIVEMLATCAQGKGNLLLNIGPRGDGSVPEESVRLLEQSGDWLARHSEAIFETDDFSFDLNEKGKSRGDWCHIGPMTVRGNNLYLLARRWTGETLTLCGLECEVKNVEIVGRDEPFSFVQSDGKIVVSGLPELAPDELCTVLRFTCDRAPTMYLCGGMRVPQVSHPHYDPCESDMLR